MKSRVVVIAVRNQPSKMDYIYICIHIHIYICICNMYIRIQSMIEVNASFAQLDQTIYLLVFRNVVSEIKDKQQNSCNF